jgi:hypothetical protein
MIGATNPLASAPGTIRGDYCIDVGRNIIHGSDSVDAAKHEIGLCACCCRRAPMLLPATALPAARRPLPLRAARCSRSPVVALAAL